MKNWVCYHSIIRLSYTKRLIAMKVGGCRANHAYTRYQIYCFTVQLTQTGFQQLCRRQIEMPKGQLVWATSDEILIGKQGIVSFLSMRGERVRENLFGNNSKMFLSRWSPMIWWKNRLICLTGLKASCSMVVADKNNHWKSSWTKGNSSG